MAALTPMDWLSTVVGLAGTLAVVSAYLGLQLGYLEARSWRYNLLNLGGAIGILLSLLVHFNLASFIIQVFWIGASLVGLRRLVRSRKRNKGVSVSADKATPS